MSPPQLLAKACEHGDPGYCAPDTNAFVFKPLVQFTVAGVHFEITKITLLVWLAVVLILWFFVAAVRNPKLVPDRLQWMGETAYGFVRNGIAREVIGSTDGLRFAPYLASLFFFIIVNNIWGIIPVAQIASTSHIAYPIFMAIISWVLFNAIGIQRKGFGRYFKDMLFPPGVPKPLYVLVTPIEFFSTLIVRPVTLAIRLFANMFAGHLLLLIFATGTTYLLTVGNFSAVFSPVSFVMSIVLTFFELLVETLQAYVFTVLTAAYLSGAIAEEH